MSWKQIVVIGEKNYVMSCLFKSMAAVVGIIWDIDGIYFCLRMDLDLKQDVFKF